MAMCSNLLWRCLIALTACADYVKGATVSDKVINYQLGGSDWAATCKTGQRQSPIDIAPDALTPMTLSPLNVTYENSSMWSMWASLNYLEVEKISTKSQVRTDTSSAGNGITMDAYGFAMDGSSAAGLYVPLNQYHFHSPSENTFDGVAYPLEMHMVHKLFENPQSASGKLLVATVVAVMFRLDPSDAANPFIDQLLYGPLSSSQVQDFLNSSASVKLDQDDPKAQFNLMTSVFALAPPDRYFAFNGSLTTPTCTEGINWRVVATPLTISRTQLKTFKDVLALRQGGNSRGGDARATQSRNGRTIMASFTPMTMARRMASKADDVRQAGLIHV